MLSFFLFHITQLGLWIWCKNHCGKTFTIPRRPFEKSRLDQENFINLVAVDEPIAATDIKADPELKLANKIKDRMKIHISKQSQKLLIVSRNFQDCQEKRKYIMIYFVKIPASSLRFHENVQGSVLAKTYYELF